MLPSILLPSYRNAESLSLTRVLACLADSGSLLHDPPTLTKPLRGIRGVQIIVLPIPFPLPMFVVGIGYILYDVVGAYKVQYT